MMIRLTKRVFMKRTETGNKISKRLTGRTLSEETKQKISNSMKGKRNRYFTEEQKEIQSEKMRIIWDKRKH